MNKSFTLTIISVTLLLILATSAVAQVSKVNKELLVDRPISQGDACKVNLTSGGNTFPGYAPVPDAEACGSPVLGDVILPGNLEVANSGGTKYKSDEYFVFNNIKLLAEYLDVSLDLSSAPEFIMSIPKSEYDLNSSAYKNYLDCVMQGDNCRGIVIQSGAACAEEILLDFDNRTNSISNFEFLKGSGVDTCGTLFGDESSQQIDIKGSNFNLPTPFKCSGYTLEINGKSADNWPATGFYDLTNSGNNEYSMNTQANGNKVGFTVTTDGDQKPEKVELYIYDGSSDSGGISWKLYCDPINIEGDNNKATCEGMGGEWNQTVADTYDGWGCCGDDTSDYGKTYPNKSATDKLPANYCGTNGFREMAEQDCSVDFLEENDLFITDIPPALCAGEVLRIQNASFLARPLSWQQAQVGPQSCTVTELKGSQYLNVKPSASATAPDLFTGECGDGVCNPSETCDTCSADCGTCDGQQTGCGDGVCEANECGTCQQDCDSDFDQYNKSVCSGTTDCNDTDPTVNPDATEICDNKDNDCDGSVDEGIDQCQTGDGGGDGDGSTGDPNTKITQAGYEDDFDQPAVTAFASHQTSSSSCECSNGVVTSNSCGSLEPYCTTSTSCDCIDLSTDPECSDGVDNDGDGNIDMEDEQCTSESDDSEASTGGGDGKGPSESFNYPYWVECAIPQNWNNLQVPPESDAKMGGYNFNQPQEGDDPSIGSVVCYQGQERKTYYCARNLQRAGPGGGAGVPEWASNLDDSKYKGACSAYNETWTGTYCCSEADDPGESYNDPGENGACFNGTFQANDGYLTLPNGTTDRSVLVQDGTFVGCGEISEYSNMRSQPDPGSNGDDQGPLVHERDSCEYSPSGNYYCSGNGTWEAREGITRNNTKQVGWSDFNGTQTGCCASDQCWNGTTCVPSHEEGEGFDPEQGALCIDGHWSTAHTKTSMDGTKTGFCPETDQCLVNPDSPCVEPGYYQDDNYCLQGNWTTRTRMVAEKIYDLAEEAGDFRMHCDDTTDALLQESNTGDVEKFCTLFTEDNVVLGAALSGNPGENAIEDFTQKLASEYERAYSGQEQYDGFDHTCTDATTDYEKCIDLEYMKGYYDNATKTILLSREGIEDNLLQQAWDAIVALFTDDEEELNLRDFSKLFIAKKDGKRIQSLSEKVYDREDDIYRHYIKITWDHPELSPSDFQNMIEEGEFREAEGGTGVIFNKTSQFSDASWKKVSGEIRLS